MTGHSDSPMLFGGEGLPAWQAPCWGLTSLVESAQQPLEAEMTISLTSQRETEARGEEGLAKVTQQVAGAG